MAKDKIKLVFEIDRFKVIGCVERNCETKEEYDELVKIINGTDEVVRNDKETEKTNCVLIFASCCTTTRIWLFANAWRARMKHFTMAKVTVMVNSNVKCIEIKGNVAKELFDKIASLADNGKDGE